LGEIACADTLSQVPNPRLDFDQRLDRELLTWIKASLRGTCEKQGNRKSFWPDPSRSSGRDQDKDEGTQHVGLH
jgi:hypothetical protein